VVSSEASADTGVHAHTAVTHVVSAQVDAIDAFHCSDADALELLSTVPALDDSTINIGIADADDFFEGEFNMGLGMFMEGIGAPEVTFGDELLDTWHGGVVAGAVVATGTGTVDDCGRGSSDECDDGYTSASADCIYQDHGGGGGVRGAAGDGWDRAHGSKPRQTLNFLLVVHGTGVGNAPAFVPAPAPASTSTSASTPTPSRNAGAKTGAGVAKRMRKKGAAATAAAVAAATQQQQKLAAAHVKAAHAKAAFHVVSVPFPKSVFKGKRRTSLSTLTWQLSSAPPGVEASPVVCRDLGETAAKRKRNPTLSDRISSQNTYPSCGISTNC